MDITGSVNANSSDLTLAAGDQVEVVGDVNTDSSQLSVVGDLIIGGDLNANGDSNAVSSTGQMDITGSVNANSSDLSLAAGDLMIGGNLNANGTADQISDLNIAASGQVEIVGDIYTNSADLALSGNQLRFGGGVVEAASLRLTASGGDDESPVLFLNQNGVRLSIDGDFNLDSNAPAGVAGLGTHGSLTLEAENIDLGQSIITALGDLQLIANDSLTVKDLNAVEDLILEGSELIIQSDEGRTVDMICGGDFVADVDSVTKIGNGTFRFASTTGIELSQAFLQSVGPKYQIGQPDSNFNANSLGKGTLRLLDATSIEQPAQLLPPDEDQLAAQTAQTARAERELGMAENQAFEDAFNISVQTNSLGELGRRLGLVSLDANNVGGVDNRATSISELRLRPSAARAAVAAHQELMASGSSKILQAAWDRFTADRESVDPTAFRVWLAEADEVLAQEGWAAHDRMRAALRLSGLTPSEARAAVQAANANLGVAELSEALQTILGGVRGEEATASAGPAPEAPAA